MKSMFRNDLPQRVFINEVATRDGFQSEAIFVPTEQKIALVDQLSQTGLNKIEVTSFVSPKAIPNLRDAETVMQQITRNPEITYVALVPNEKGCERALACNVDEINVVMSVSETHNMANMRMTRAQSLQQFARISALLSDSTMRINGSISTAFGCPYEGLMSRQATLDVVDQMLDAGIQSISIADTTGMAEPVQVYELCSEVRARYPELELTLHLHNTRGMGLANVLAGLAAGIDQFDSSLGGIGGCPYAPGATGNICSEDLIHMLESMAIDTGVDLDALLKLSRQLPELLGHDVPGQINKAGLRSEVRPAPAGLGQKDSPAAQRPSE